MSEPRTVTYRSPKSGELVTITEIEVEGRYPHLYLTLDTGKHVIRIPREVLLDE